MKNSSYTTYIVIIMTFVFALMLRLLPLPEWAESFRPAWVVSVLIYWVVALPHRVGIGWAFMLGLFVDVANGTTLGVHALVFTCVAYLTLNMHQRLRVFPLWQQAAVVFLLVLVYQGLLSSLNWILNPAANVWPFGWQVLVSALLWPWLFIILRDCRRLFKVIE